MELESQNEVHTVIIKNSIANGKCKRAANVSANQSVDANSNINEDPKKVKPNKASNAKKPQAIQSLIGDDRDGNFQIQSPKCKLQLLWETYRQSHK